MHTKKPQVCYFQPHAGLPDMSLHILQHILIYTQTSGKLAHCWAGIEFFSSSCYVNTPTSHSCLIRRLRCNIYFHMRDIFKTALLFYTPQIQSRPRTANVPGIFADSFLPSSPGTIFSLLKKAFWEWGRYSLPDCRNALKGSSACCG